MTAADRPPLGRWIGAVLRFGTLGAVVLIGLGFALATLVGEPPPGPVPVTETVDQARPDALIGIGLLGLTLIPALVLGAASVAFFRAGEARMAGVSVAVLALLLGSLLAAVVIGSAI